MDNMVGGKVGVYDIVSVIGRGGMGTVYEGVQDIIGKKVAVKVLLPQFSRDGNVLERFVGEARSVNAIGHRGIVDIFSFGYLLDGAAYFVMELLEGQPLDVILAEQGALGPGSVLGLLDETLDALDAAHAAGVIHRDLKPSNLFRVTPAHGRSYVKLLDFGVAKLLPTSWFNAPVTQVATVIGTPTYMSPEQARGEPVTAASDIYGLGCVAFELLTGQVPFDRENAAQVMCAHLEAPAPSACALNPAVPPELDALVAKMMEKKPGDRPVSAAALRREVRALRERWPDDGLLAPGPMAAPQRPLVRAGDADPLATTVERPRAGVRPAQGHEARVPAMVSPWPPTVVANWMSLGVEPSSDEGSGRPRPERGTIIGTPTHATPPPPVPLSARRSRRTPRPERARTTHEPGARMGTQTVNRPGGEIPMPRETAPMPMRELVGAAPEPQETTAVVKMEELLGIYARSPVPSPRSTAPMFATGGTVRRYRRAAAALSAWRR